MLPPCLTVCFFTVFHRGSISLKTALLLLWAAAAQSPALSDVLPWVWLAGAAIMIGYGVLSYLRLRRRLRFAVRDKTDPRIWYSDRICSPCVVRLLQPKIYLTFGLNETETGHILAHERQHLRIGDHLWKALGWLILSVH